MVGDEIFLRDGALLDSAMKSMFEFSYDIDDRLKQLELERPVSPLSRILNAYLAVLSSEYSPSRSALEEVHSIRETFTSISIPERAHLDVIEAWGSGEFNRAQRLLDALLIQFPKDILALFVGHQLDFFLGDAQSLRDRVGSAVTEFDRSDPMYGYLLGMFAFGLEECGWYERALEVGHEALDRAATDVWALHAVVHSHEMRAEFYDGLDLLKNYESGWTGSNFFKPHNYWHKCLYLLEIGDIEGILGIYDSMINPPGAGIVALTLLDASAILWRLFLDSVDVGDRFEKLCSAWEECLDEPFYVFNDCHAIMAFVGAGRFDLADKQVDILRNSIATSDLRRSNAVMTSAIGLPVAEAIVAFGRGDHRQVIEKLYPIRKEFYRFGGSHAQRDVFHRTLVESAICLPDLSLAANLVDQRIALKEGSPYNWFAKRRILMKLGDPNQALLAGSMGDSFVR